MLQRVLGIALRSRWIVVHFEENAVYPAADAGARKRLDVFGLAGRDSVTAAGELKAVRDVEDNRHPKLGESSETHAYQRRDCDIRSSYRAR